jgi:dihydrodipicolinate synthase/N-acetylneuraminate lyase
MRTQPFSDHDPCGVFAVPPLARRNDSARTLDCVENRRIVDHIARAGITRLIYGGNACLHHLTLAEYEQLLDWLSGLPKELLCIPSAGPSFGRAMDQAPLLRRHGFPLVMMLPCGDPRDAAGLECGIREFGAAAGMPVMVYLKDEANFGPDRAAGLDAVARLVDSKVCAAIKYAVVRQNPANDSYLAELLRRVERAKVISGIGERPAVVHLRDWHLPGFTTGLGCIAPDLSKALHQACLVGDHRRAEEIRGRFLPLENLRDQWGPARVLHAAVELAGIATTGPIPPFQSPLESSQRSELLRAIHAFQEENQNSSRQVAKAQRDSN